MENFLVGKGLMRQDAAKQISTLEWTSLQFNASGSQILATTSRYAALLDGFTAQILQTFELPTLDDEQQQPEPITACFTQDDSYILTGGCRDGSIQCWEASTGTLLQTLTGHVDGPIRAVACNPKRAMFASSSINTALWI
jgi:WD40 repeat protein